jgi:HAD superfamily hydrolase (TIGR01549 family)
VSQTRWVVFDLGETLADETSNWGRWADYLGIPRFTFFAVLGGVLARRGDHTEVFSYFRDGFDLEAEIAEKTRAGLEWRFDDTDLYPDAVETLTKLRDRGYRLAIVANQPLTAEPFLRSLPVDHIATSGHWGVAKPHPAFFDRLVEETGIVPHNIAYVGDRVDNDVLPAKARGIVAVHVRRGPWGYVQSEWPEASKADLRITSLHELIDGLLRLRFTPP